MSETFVPGPRAKKKKRTKKQMKWGKRFGKAVRSCKREVKGKGKKFNACMRRKLHK